MAAPSDYKGITVNFRRTQLYKDLAKQVTEMNPTLPQYLIDVAIHTHMTQPRAYRERPNKDVNVPSHAKDGNRTIDCVGVYDADDDALKCKGFVPGTEPWVAHPQQHTKIVEEIVKA